MDTLDTLLAADRYLYSEDFLAAVCADYEAGAANGETPDVFETLGLLKDRDPAAESLELALREIADPAAALAELCAYGPAAAAARHLELVEAAQAGGEPAGTDEDEDAWNAYLAQNGPAWDGAEESWPGFRDWFVYYADEAGVSRTAAAFLAYADQAADKRGVFAEYGVGIASPAVMTDAVPEAPADTVADEIADSVIKDFRSQYPEFEELDDASLREMIADAVKENAAPAAETA